MNLQKRVEELEHRVGASDETLLILITSFVGCDQEKSGADRAIYREVTCYRALSRDREWLRAPGESLADLKARMNAELSAEGHKVYAVCECYD